MILSFADRATERLFHGRAARRIPRDVLERARRKLDAINAARSIQDLRAPPGNQLEALQGDRTGQHSIRVNERWRICFRFEGGDSYDVDIVDYH